MIKKLGLLILCILLIVAIVNVHQNGLVLFGRQIPSYAEIVQRNNELDRKIAEVDQANTITYKRAEDEKKSAENLFNSTKRNYEEIAANASAADIAEANKREEYFLDYLWIKIGNYANANDIKVLIGDNEKESTIKFDVSGQYISLINFIYDLENDSELEFNVDNIVMEGASNATSAKASFTVVGVNIIRATEQ